VRKRDRVAKFVGFYGPTALKRDLRLIAKVENRSLSATVCALLRLGIGRYFELADARMVAPLLARMRDVFGDPFGAPMEANAKRVRMAEHAANAAEFDAAIDAGQRAFTNRSA
jgi:hypothetical protein